MELNGSWSEYKGGLKQKFELLTNSNSLILEGKHDEIIERLEIKLGKSKEEISRLISQL